MIIFVEHKYFIQKSLTLHIPEDNILALINIPNYYNDIHKIL